jgi:predicted TIM-barrel fold metal-dependent hydrolase
MTSAAQVRERLDHPVIDADGHTIEFMPAVREVLSSLAGNDVSAKLFESPTGLGTGWYRRSAEQRAATRQVRAPWWGVPAENTLDRTTAMLPGLLDERLGELGIDYAVVYPTSGLQACGHPVTELRQALCRAINTYHAEVFAPHKYHLTPVAVIPMHTPEEAIAELDHAVGTLGMKAVMMAGIVERPIGAVQEAAPAAARYARWIDSLGIDSAYDYDPVWQRCVDLKVSPAFHSGGMGWGSRASMHNYMFNHLGHFAAAGEATCRSLFMSGVTKRFPTLRLAFLEGGVGWASNLYNDIIGHWEKRNRETVLRYDPRRLDVDLMERLFRSHGGPVVARLQGDLRARLERYRTSFEPEEMLDEWAPIGLERAEDVIDRFARPFYFGCEADDPMNAMAFDTRLNRFSARLQAIFSSDIGHWDVPDMREVLEEAYELVEHELLSEDDFRDFTFANVTRLYGEANPSFFEGTAVADACRSELATEPATAAVPTD